MHENEADGLIVKCGDKGFKDKKGGVNVVQVCFVLVVKKEKEQMKKIKWRNRRV